jgi:hypothetical protein
VGNGGLVKDASGNVGIGVTPSYKLNVAGTDGTAYVNTGATARVPTGALVVAQTNNATVGVSSILDMSANGQHAWIGAVDSGSGYSPNMVFGVSTAASSWAERMRIDASGRLLVGLTSPQSGYIVQAGNSSFGGGFASSANGAGDAGYYSAGSAIGYHFYGAGASSKVFYVTNNGNAYNSNNVFAAVSDIKLKENIVNDLLAVDEDPIVIS